MKQKITFFLIMLLMFSYIQAEMVAYYDFNQSSGTILPDLSGKSNTGTLINMSDSSWQAGRTGSGNSLFFDDGNKYVSISESASLNISEAITVSAWVKADSIAGNHRRIVEKNYSTSWYFGTGDNGSTSLSVWMNNAPRLNTGNVFNLNEWTHVAFTYDRQYVKIYVNGQEAASAAYTAAIGLDDQDIWIAAWKLNYANWLGSIDDVGIWNEALTPLEMGNLYDYGISDFNIPEPGTFSLFAILILLSYSKLKLRSS